MHLSDLVSYLSELSENNNRAWFVMNKPRYDILRGEFLVLVTNLIHQISQFDPLVRDCDPKKAIFRINRDVRFAKDKSPYKTTFSAAIVPNNLKKPSQGGGPAYYFHIDASGELFFAVGEYMPPTDRLKQIRTCIADHGASLVTILKDKKCQTTFHGLEEQDKLQRPPKGVNPDHPQIDLIKLKSFMMWAKMPLSEFKKGAQTEILTHTLVNGYKNAFQFVSWLRNSR